MHRVEKLTKYFTLNWPVEFYGKGAPKGVHDYKILRENDSEVHIYAPDGRKLGSVPIDDAIRYVLADFPIVAQWSREYLSEEQRKALDSWTDEMNMCLGNIQYRTRILTEQEVTSKELLTCLQSIEYYHNRLNIAVEELNKIVDAR